MSGRRVLVLGATGFLGRHICDAFTAAGHEVFRVSRGGSADPAETGLALDLAATGPAELVALLARARPQVLVNAAATVWQQDPAAMRALNGEFVERLVGVLSASSARPRLVHLGSVHEYGPVSDGAELTERVQAAPTGVYGSTKLRGSRAVLRASRTPGGPEAVVLRISNVCGPGAPPESLPGLVAARLAAREVPDTGEPGTLRLAPLDAERDFVDVRNVAAAVLSAATAPREQICGRVVNIAAGRSVPVRELVRRLVELSGADVRIVEDSAPAGRAPGLDRQRVDISLAGELLSWKPELTLDDALRAMLDAARTDAKQ
jgi:nucleoside-diphosphate-sugar epimerase